MNRSGCDVEDNSEIDVQTPLVLEAICTMKLMILMILMVLSCYLSGLGL